MLSGKSYNALKKSEDSKAPKGFISPEGKFHEVPKHTDHHDWIHSHTKQNHPNLHSADREEKPGEGADGSYTNAISAGWMSVGIGRDSGGSGHNVQAAEKYLANKSNPASQKVREIARKHWGEHFEAMTHNDDKKLSHKNINTAKFIRFGVLQEHK